MALRLAVALLLATASLATVAWLISGQPLRLRIILAAVAATVAVAGGVVGRHRANRE